ncbi:MAG: efflux transporter outer membrane subunit [Verrucomicrobiota bacterium]
MRFVICHLAFVIFAAGCAVGPNYKRPDVAQPAAYRDATSSGTNSFADFAWWEIYRDPVLAGLIRTALTNNLDLKVAVTRVEQARQAAAEARSQFFPSVGYSGAVSKGRNEFAGNYNYNGGQIGDAAVGVLNAAWEVDLWGRIRRLNESARAQYLATDEARRGIRLSLVSQVAAAYFQLLELDLQLQIAQRTTNSFGGSLDIFTQRLLGGVGSKLETSRAAAALASVTASVPATERQIAVQENQINILLGRPPGPVERSATLLEQGVPPEVPAGLPSQLLSRRPDVMSAEQQLRSANAQVGVSVANFLPQIGLTAFMGKVSPELSAITLGSANAWSLAASATGPIFQGGANVAKYRQAKAFWDQNRLQYELSVLNALREVSDALVTREKLVLEREQLARSVQAYQEAVVISTQRYLAGKASYYEVLEAQQQLFPAENSLAQTELNQRLVIVQLYQALGGGWKLSDAEWDHQP